MSEDVSRETNLSDKELSRRIPIDPVSQFMSKDSNNFHRFRRSNQSIVNNLPVSTSPPRGKYNLFRQERQSIKVCVRMSTPFTPIDNPKFPQRKLQFPGQFFRLDLHFPLLQRFQFIKQRLNQHRIHSNHDHLYGNHKQHDVKRKGLFPEIIDDFEECDKEGSSD